MLGLLLWQAAALIIHQKFLLPTPGEVWTTLLEYRETLFAALWITARTALLGALFGTLAGLLIGYPLGKLPWLIGHSRRTLAVIRQNITASLVAKVGFVLLTLSGFASMWAAVAADTGVSLLVVANALRLLRR